MLSRRSVRIKVMQLLYSKDRDDSLNDRDLFNSYKHGINKSYELFLFSIYVLTRITENAEKDLEKRNSKHLPSDYDKSFTDKVHTNDLIQNVVNNKSLQKKFKSLGFSDMVNEDYTRKIYEAFAKSDHYKNYIADGNTRQDHIELLLELYRFCRQNEFFNETLEDAYYNWLDDKSLVVGAIKKYLKSLPSPDNESFNNFFPEDETVKDFGQNLLEKSIKNRQELLNYIIPVLENWDHERLAVVDTILLRMALCEMLHFPTIPGKVTLNEYVDLAKNYSTAKSKEFINGILDKLMKDLDSKGKLIKEGRGLQE
ncbi:MAG: transcription antitermination factor NusB [Saprospiraceae bacterium]|nr:transcription antitermination factor NusB [Bacteroidia bacterium]MBT8229680.1 transcription antitermination factor NusB [Bacteroidia bacterium]NNF21640.1 transcription antitermination factor NusB [Saprospiraceae bacterium]NNK90496.1 transcription antitermination factor NusB [Saprospiraceae bacterium]